MLIFIEGLIAGYGIAIPVGAIAILIVNMGMRCGFKIGFSAGAGAASADIIYAIIAVVTGTALVAILAPINLQLRILSGLLLVGMGILGLWNGLKNSKKDNRTAEICGAGQMFVQFLGITLINPLTVVYFAALVLGRQSTTLTLLDQCIFVLGVAVASLSWQSLLAWIGSIGHQKLSPRFQVFAIIFGNTVVAFLGLRILLTLSV